MPTDLKIGQGVPLPASFQMTMLYRINGMKKPALIAALLAVLLSLAQSPRLASARHQFGEDEVERQLQLNKDFFAARTERQERSGLLTNSAAVDPAAPTLNLTVTGGNRLAIDAMFFSPNQKAFISCQASGLTCAVAAWDKENGIRTLADNLTSIYELNVTSPISLAAFTVAADGQTAIREFLIQTATPGGTIAVCNGGAAGSLRNQFAPYAEHNIEGMVDWVMPDNSTRETQNGFPLPAVILKPGFQAYVAMGRKGSLTAQSACIGLGLQPTRALPPSRTFNR